MAIGALTKIITRGIVAGADNLFDETKVAEKIKTSTEKLESSLFLNPDVDVDSTELADYVEKYARHYSAGGSSKKLDPEIEDMVLEQDVDYSIATQLEKMVDVDLEGSTFNVYKSQFNSADEAQDYDPEVDRALYNYLSARLGKAENNRLLSENGREKVLTRAIATLKGMPEYKNLRESMPDFDDLSTQMKKLPAQIENKEKALEDFLAESVEKRPQFRGVSSLQDTEWDARFWMTNEIGPHVGTLGQANYFGLKALVDDNEFGKHMALFSMGIEGNKLGETFERAGLYIKPEDFNKIYDLTLQVNSYLDDFLRDLELDPNDLKAYTKLSIAEKGQLDNFDTRPEEITAVGRRRIGEKPLTGWEEIVESVATQYLGMERGNTTRDKLLLEHEVKAIAKLLGQIRGWGDNVYGSNVRPASIQKGYVNVKNPLKIGNDGSWKIEALFDKGDLLEESIFDNGGIDMFLDAMAVQLNTSRESLSKSIPFKKLNEKAQMLSQTSRDIEISSISQFEQAQAMSMELAGLHQDFRKFVESYGFDSIQYVNQVEPSFTTDSDNYSYILFKPEQWKAVSARRFDPNDKRFGAAEGGVIGFFSKLMSDQDEVKRPASRVIKKGDTLSHISRDTGVSIADLVKLNNIKNPDRIRIGDTLVLGSEARPQAQPARREVKEPERTGIRAVAVQKTKEQPPEKKGTGITLIPTNAKAFGKFLLGNVLGLQRDGADIDVGSLGQQQQTVLKNAMLNAKKDGRSYVTYKDYPTMADGQAVNDFYKQKRADTNVYDLAKASFTDPVFEMFTSLGAFNFKETPEGQFEVLPDRYDFDKSKSTARGRANPKDDYSKLTYLGQDISEDEDAYGFNFKGRIDVAKGGKIDKKKMACNKPKRTASHPKKSHVVKACKDGKEKIIRFGEQGAKTAGKPKAGESKRMKAKRKSFKARHGRNIKKGNMSAAYWADKVKW
jgi:murein DD-endopeptidase MepM/ murein hydrolase activator NlpD